MSMTQVKGAAFERDVAYSLRNEITKMGIELLGDNTKGIDIIATSLSGKKRWYIECKAHQRFSYREIEKILKRTESTLESLERDELYIHVPIVAFKANYQPVLVAYRGKQDVVIETFRDYFGIEFNKRPKGYKNWR